MTYTPRTFRKGNQSAVAHSYSTETDLLFDGWLPDPSTPPAADPHRHVEVGELAALIPPAATPAQLAADPVLRAAFVPGDPVLSAFVYDPATGNLTSYQEDGVTITLTYNADGTVATSKRGTAAAKTYTYSGGNLAGVA